MIADGRQASRTETEVSHARLSPLIAPRDDRPSNVQPTFTSRTFPWSEKNNHSTCYGVIFNVSTCVVDDSRSHSNSERNVESACTRWLFAPLATNLKINRCSNDINEHTKRRWKCQLLPLKGINRIILEIKEHTVCLPVYKPV